MNLDPAAKVDVAIARELLATAMADLIARTKNEDAVSYLSQWWTEQKATFPTTTVPVIAHPNDDVRAMYVLREEAEQFGTPVLVRQMSITVLRRLRRKMRSREHPWFGCALVPEQVTGTIDLDVYLDAHPEGS